MTGKLSLASTLGERARREIVRVIRPVSTHQTSSTASFVLRISVTLGILVVATGPAESDCIRYEDYLHRISSTPINSGVGGIAVGGSIAYVCLGMSGLGLFDAAHPSSLPQVSIANTPGLAHDVALAGTYACIADGQSGLQIADVSNMLSPTIVGSVDTPGNAVAVFVVDTHAYVADETGGLQIIDISLPSAPAIVGSFPVSDRALDVIVANTLAYVADRSAGLVIIDITDPANPASVGAVNTPGWALGLASMDPYVLVADRAGGLQVIDARTPASPIIVGAVATPGYASAVAVQGVYAYLADGAGFHIYNMSDPENPSLVAGIEVPVYTSIAVTELHAFLGGSHSYPQIGDDPVLDVISMPSNSQTSLIGSVSTVGVAAAVAVSGSYAFVCPWETGLQVVDCSNPMEPTVVGGVDTPGSAVAIELEGSYAYIADDVGGLLVADISDPASPVIVGNFPTPSSATDVCSIGDYAYIAGGSTGLLIVSVADPESPTLAGSVDTPGYAQGVAVQGNFAYVADAREGLQVIDVSNPASPLIVGGIDTSDLDQEVVSIAVADNYAYLVVYDAINFWVSWLQVIDISVPTTPILRGSTFMLNQAGGLAVQNAFVYVTDAYEGVEVVDVSDPDWPAIIGGVATGGWAYGIFVSDYMYVADLSEGLVLASTQCSIPTGIAEFAFNATSQSDGIRLTWSSPVDSQMSRVRVTRAEQKEGPYSPLYLEEQRESPAGSFLDVDVRLGGTFFYLLEATRRDGSMFSFGPVSARIDPGAGLRPTLGQAYPNPLQGGSSTIPFTLSQPGGVKIRILDLSGREVRLLVDRVMERGEQSVLWDGRDGRGEMVPAGTYLYQLLTPGFEASRKMVRLR